MTKLPEVSDVKIGRSNAQQRKIRSPVERIEMLPCLVELSMRTRRLEGKPDASGGLRERQRRRQLMKHVERGMKKGESVAGNRKKRLRLNCKRRRRQGARQDVSRGLKKKLNV
jgi:hypothetical protein